MPFPTTRVIHQQWAARHAPVAQGAMNATCEVFTVTGGDWNASTGSTPGTKTTVYTGPCRVQYQSTQPRTSDAADQPVTSRGVLVAVPRGANIPVGDRTTRVKVTAVDGNGPTRLVGRTLAVVASQFSSLAFEQDLTCIDDQTNQGA